MKSILFSSEHLALTITEFENVSSLKWNNRENLFIIVVNISKVARIDSGQLCYINVTGSPDVLEHNKPGWNNRYKHWMNYKLAASSPLFLNESMSAERDFRNGSFRLEDHFLGILKRDLLVELPGSYLYMNSNMTSSWNEASSHCRELKGSLFSLEAYEQWHTIMENVHYVFHKNHYKFWLSSLLFLGKPTLRQVLLKAGLPYTHILAGLTRI